jgi:hypothetical protein
MRVKTGSGFHRSEGDIPGKEHVKLPLVIDILRKTKLLVSYSVVDP